MLGTQRIRLNSLFVSLLLLVSISACDLSPKSGYGFTLPEGDTTQGEEAFVRFACNDCHIIENRPDLRLNEEELPMFTKIKLGGDTSRIKTYGELVTSVINPSHKISQKYSGEAVQFGDVSLMRNYNDAMTVSELIDLIAFVQEQYELEPHHPTPYMNYYTLP